VFAYCCNIGLHRDLNESIIDGIKSYLINKALLEHTITAFQYLKQSKITYNKIRKVAPFIYRGEGGGQILYFV